ncbi:MAG: PQQ-like beta-propeller repeat protein [Lentisphaerae bacterium]|jgi:outer membrane protein assembly factor BamB|nr:PQQ-like beta-propeller repeat protein [Lentisphaerota bacterium]
MISNSFGCKSLVALRGVWRFALWFCLLLSSCRRAGEAGGAADDAARMQVRSMQTGQVLAPPALIAGEVVAGTADGRVFCMRGEGSYCKLSDCAMTSAVRCFGERFYVGDDDGVLHCYDAKGEIHWRFKTDGKITGAVVAWRDLIIVGSYDQVLYALTAADGGLRWRCETKGFIHGSAAIDDEQGWIFLGNCDGVLRKISATDGSVLAEIDLESPIPASVVYADGRCYLLTHQGDLLCVDGAGMGIRWRSATGDAATSSPLLLKDAVLTCSSAGEVAVFDRENGTLLKRLSAELRLAPLAAFSADIACGLSKRGMLYLFPAARGYDPLPLKDCQCDVENAPVADAGVIAFADDLGGVWRLELPPAFVRTVLAGAGAL